MTDQEAELGQITDQGAASTSPFNFQSAVEKQKQLSPPPKKPNQPKNSQQNQLLQPFKS